MFSALTYIRRIPNFTLQDNTRQTKILQPGEADFVQYG